MKNPPSSSIPYEAILESISDGVFTVDLQWRITSFNRSASLITGVSKDDAIGELCSDVFRSSLCSDSCALRQTLNTGKPIIGKSAYIINSQGQRVPISLSTAQLFDYKGNLIGATETFRDLSEIEALRSELLGRYQFGELASRNPIMQRLFEVLPAIASSPSTVLIFGETGTGKELMAKTIHSMSPRCKGPFVAVNCGALPDTLLESELFGYKAGAFTGANKDKPGRFAMAKGGTLFLDEIGDVSPALQVRLLRVLQERTYEPLGSTKSEPTDVRIIAATSRNIAEMMKRGEFREDLYYRLNVVSVSLPPLRKRKEDIPLIAEQFILKLNAIQQRQIQGFEPEALSLLMAYDWHGNIRELENIIERSFILCTEGRIGIGHLPEELTACASSKGAASDLRSSHDLMEANAIFEALKKHNLNHNKAAEALGIHRTTLFRKIKRLGLQI